VVLEVTLEVGGRVGSVTGAKLSFGCPVEPNVVKATGPEDDGNMMGSHVVLDRRREGWLNLQGDFIKNALISHKLWGGWRVGSNQNHNLRAVRGFRTCEFHHISLPERTLSIGYCPAASPLRLWSVR
jgi:hypothetical protein